MKSGVETSRVRVFVVSASGLLRESLAMLLERERDIEVAGRCATLEEAVEMPSQAPADVLLVDSVLRGDRGCRLLEALSARRFPGRVLLLAERIGPQETFRLFCYGLAGIVHTNSSPAMLAKSVRKVASGEFWLDRECFHAILRSVSELAREKLQPALSLREKTILQCLMDGLANKEIAERLKVPESTVKGALRHLFRKTGVSSRSQLVRVALEEYRGDLGQLEASLSFKPVEMPGGNRETSGLRLKA